MSKSERMLGELYVDAGSHLIEFDGRRQVLGSVRLQLSQAMHGHRPCAVRARGPAAGGGPERQARRLEVAGQRGTSVVLWDYAPFPVEVELIARRGPFVILVYNVWKGPYEATMAGFANGGMAIREFTDKHLVLDCNAGPREVTFTDATVTISWPADVTVHLLLPWDEPASDAQR